jgi:tetratricopeptide (TPR) repeat protein
VGLFAESVGRSSLPGFISLEPGEASEIAPPLRRLNELVLAPEAATPPLIVPALQQIAEWAAQQGFETTQAAFLALAAVVQPMNSALACDVGKVERKRANYDRAVEWFRRAVALARRTGDDRAYIDAYMAWGTVEERRERRVRARQMYTRAWRRSKEAGLSKLGARARHNMLSLLVDGGDFTEAMTHAEAAFKLYGLRNPKVASLATDVAALWCEHGYFDVAVSLIESVIPQLEPGEQNAAWANLARAAGMLGDQQRFFTAWNALTSPERPTKQFLAAGLAQVAYGALHLGMVRQAAELVAEARELAVRRGELAVLCAVAEVEQAIREGSSRPETKQATPTVIDFTNRLLSRLQHLASS